MLKTIFPMKTATVKRSWYIMHKFLYLFPVIILIVVSCTQNETTGPYFWKVEKDGKTAYFLGTLHKGVALEELQCSQKINTHLKSSDYLFTEADINSQEQEDLNEANKEKLRNILLSENNQDFQSLSDDSKIFFSSRGVSEGFSYLGYIYIINTLCTEQAIGSGSISIDLQVKAIAQLNSIPTEYLDEGMNTEAVSDSLLNIHTYTNNEEVSNNLVNNKVLNFEDCILSYTNFLNQYKAGNMSVNSFSDDSIDTVLLKDRNEKWFVKFKNAHAQYNQIFLASGTAHFIGNFNLLDMLKADGFSISRMNTSCEY